MPTVFRTRRGRRVTIYPNDHRPRHVHVIDGARAARFELLCDLGMVRLMSMSGVAHGEIGQVALELAAHIGKLCNAWEAIHGR